MIKYYYFIDFPRKTRSLHKNVKRFRTTGDYSPTRKRSVILYCISNIFVIK